MEMLVSFCPDGRIREAITAHFRENYGCNWYDPEVSPLTMLGAMHHCSAITDSSFPTMKCWFECQIAFACTIWKEGSQDGPLPVILYGQEDCKAGRIIYGGDEPSSMEDLYATIRLIKDTAEAHGCELLVHAWMVRMTGDRVTEIIPVSVKAAELRRAMASHS